MKMNKNWGLLTLSLSLSAMMTISCSKKKSVEEGDGSEITSIDTGSNGSKKIAGLPTIYFEFNSFSLSSTAKESLVLAAKWLKANKDQKVQIEGHCDERGTTEYNLALGERRASAVKNFLTSKGVSAGQLSTISYGEERPVDAGHDEAAWAKNRRDDFVSGM
jgi:peptidoglycan-associated lipoprotein